MSFSGRRQFIVAQLLKRAAVWPFRVAAARATLKTLAGMDSRELADIGLRPSDLRDVSALALDRDPTSLLARRALERGRGVDAPRTASAGCEPVPARARPGGRRPPPAVSKQA